MPKEKMIVMVPPQAKRQVSLYEAATLKIDAIDAQIKKLQEAKAMVNDLINKGMVQLMEVHKEIGDFKVGDWKVSLSKSTSVIIHDESKLPDECFKEMPKQVVKANVKALIIEGKIPKDTAEQKSTTSLSIKAI